MVEDIKAALEGRPLTLGFDTAGRESATSLVQAFSKDEPATVATVAGVPDAAKVPANVTVKDITLGDAYQVPEKCAAAAVHVREIMSLIAAGRVVPNEIHDGGHGLEAIPAALKAHKTGAGSGKKVVVTLA